jgi:hypothetical protein
MPVGSNGCHQGGESPAAAPLGRRYRQRDPGCPEPRVRSPDLFAIRGSGRRTVLRPHLRRRREIARRPGYPKVTDLRESFRAPLRDGQGGDQRRDHASGLGVAAYLGRDHGQPTGPGAARIVRPVFLLLVDEDDVGGPTGRTLCAARAGPQPVGSG